jgi:uncharacterized membrane protein YkgB
MKIDQAIILIGVVALITLLTIFSQSAFYHLSTEANNGITNTTSDNSTVNQYQQTYSWIYVIGIIMVIAAIIVAYRILQDTAAT